VDLLRVDGRVPGAAADGEVVGAEHDRPAVDARRTRDEVGRPDRTRTVGQTGERADLGEAPGVGQPVDALADGEASGRALPRDLLRAAHVPRGEPPAADLLDLRRPVAVCLAGGLHAGDRNLADTWHPGTHDVDDPTTQDQWGTADPMSEVIGKEQFNDPDVLFTPPPL
jgi:hypothetical protein